MGLLADTVSGLGIKPQQCDSNVSTIIFRFNNLNIETYCTVRIQQAIQFQAISLNPVI